METRIKIGVARAKVLLNASVLMQELCPTGLLALTKNMKLMISTNPAFAARQTKQREQDGKNYRIEISAKFCNENVPLDFVHHVSFIPNTRRHKIGFARIKSCLVCPAAKGEYKAEFEEIIGFMHLV